VSVFLKNDIKAELVAKQGDPELLIISIGDRELLLLAAYIAPVKSLTGVVNPYEVIARVITGTPRHTHTLLTGDLNTRVADFNRMWGGFDPEDPFGIVTGEAESGGEVRRWGRRRTPEGDMARRAGAIHPRISKDTVCDPRGSQCLQFCDDMAMDILNGCCAGDEEGAWTFTARGGSARSVNDLGIASAGLFERVESFQSINVVTRTMPGQAEVPLRLAKTTMPHHYLKSRCLGL